jgi:DNA-binding beta-propeller fold protein YncE
MVRYPERISTVVPRLLAVVWLIGHPQIGSAAGTWSLIAPKGAGIGQVNLPRALAVDTGGNLYVADLPSGYDDSGRIQRRDAQGTWSVLATQGASALAVDGAGNLYLADGNLQKRDAQGNWFFLGLDGSDLGPLTNVSALCLDVAGNLYVVDYARILKRDFEGTWSVIAPAGAGLGQVNVPTALAVDAAGNLYVADGFNGSDRIQKRDPEGNWSVIASAGRDLGQVRSPTALAADGAGNLYVAETFGNPFDGPIRRIQKRDDHGNWSEIAGEGEALGQVHTVSSMALDQTGNLYVADAGNNRVQVYTPGP